MKKAIFILIFACVVTAQAKSQISTDTPKGELIQIKIDAPSLSNNLIGESSTQDLVVYLPPSYSKSTKRYPVVYFLPGFMDHTKYWVNGRYQGFRLRESMDKLIARKKLKEMIVVIPNGRNIFEGSFYANSVVTGNWRDFIVKDVVTYIDTKYRTLKKASSRGISGHSMGGFGAINIAMRHPDIFGMLYALSPGVFAKDSLKNHFLFKYKSRKKSYLKKEKKYSEMPIAEAKEAFFKIVPRSTWQVKFLYGYGMAFSPRTDKFPYIKYPYSIKNGELILDQTIWNEWNNGFGRFDEKVLEYKGNFNKLQSIVFEVGKNDYHKWIVDGCKYLSSIFQKNNIKHSLVIFDGDHENKVRIRIEKYMLPHFSEYLDFSHE